MYGAIIGKLAFLGIEASNIQAVFGIHVDLDDLDSTPFDAKGGRGMMWQLFGEEMDCIINEMNEVLAA